MGAKVLLFCPTYLVDDKMAVDKRTTQSIYAQKWDGDLTIQFGLDNPYPIGQLENVLVQYQAGRAMCLDGGYDALLTVEHDMILPEDALNKLWAVDQPVVYGVYVMRHGPPRLSAWINNNIPGVGKALDRHPDELAKALEAVVYPVSGVGLGCTLIRREILERFEFHDGDDPTPDVPFALDLIEAGIQQYAHFGVACGHILETGEIIWPSWVTDREGIVMGNKAIYIAMTSFAGQIGMVRYQFNKDDLYELDQARAASYVREGLIRPYTPAPVKFPVPAERVKRPKNIAKPKAGV